MVTGKRPFAEKKLSRLFETHLHQDIPDPIEFQPHLPDGLSRFIRKAAQRDPQQRYQTAEQALSALRSLAGDLGLTRNYHLNEESKISTILLIYNEEKRLELIRLMEEFGNKAKTLGVTVKISEVREF